jgi:NAD(P)-dependent dehydrogenase (short-subunit alcohol dehydrogenase family)
MAAAKFQERVAIVTGTRGMGRAIAVAMAAHGASVVVVDREPEFAEAAADAVIANGGAAIPVTADVGREKDVERFVEATVTNFGRIDFLVATAAIQFFDVGTVVDTTPEQWEQTLRVNLTGVYFCSRSCIPHMAAQGGGAIVAISSDCSIRTCVNSAAYVASKSGLNGLVRALAVDHGHQGIRANTIIPGVTDTPGLLVAYGSGGRNLEASLAKVAALSPLGRVGHAEDIASAAVFLCSDDSSFVTGSELFVDGGMTVTYGAE